jgi:hypothetical protein
MEFFQVWERFNAAVKGQNREAGLDLISRGGTVVVQVEPK